MRDPKTEQFLDSGSYKWTYVEKVDFSEIDMKASQENPARLYQPVDQERAFSYALAMESGADFPAIVLLTLDSATSVLPYLIATGVHRVTGAKEHKIRDWFDAYVVAEADSYRRMSLIHRLNILEGYGVSIKDRIAQALQEQLDYPELTLTKLAKDWNLKFDALKQAKAMQTGVDRGRRLGYALDDGRLKPTSIVALNQIHSDKVFDRAARFAITNNVSANDLTNLSKDIKKARGDEAALAIIEHLEHVAAEKRIKARARHGRISPAAATTFFGDCRRINNQADKGIEKLHLAAYPDRKAARSLCEQTIDLMRRVLAAIDHIDRIEMPAAERPAPPMEMLH
jgi:hypothetical protein